jgi:hypothetical protein
VSKLQLLLSASFLVMGLAGCSLQLPAAPAKAASTETAPTSSTPASAGATAGTSANAAAGTSSNAAAGTQLAGSAGPVDAADNPIKPGPQGIAVGEPNPSGGRVIGTTAILTPCRKDFLSLDANGDGWIDLAEWKTAGNAEADFKAKDKDASGQLDNGEYGCQDAAPGGVAPNGRG